MKLQQKIILASFVAAILLTVLFFLINTPKYFSDAAMYFGIIAFFGGLLEFVVGLLLLFMEDKRFAQGLLISSGLLIVIGFITCTGSFSVH